VAAEQLVDGDVEVGGEREQGLEGEPALAALGLRDGARRHPGELGELGLAQLALHAHRAEGATEPGRGRSLGELWPAVGEAVVVHAPLHADGPALRLGDAQPALAQNEHALGDVLDIAPQRLGVLALGERPVGDRADLQKEWAAAGEERRAISAPQFPTMSSSGSKSRSVRV